MRVLVGRSAELSELDRALGELRDGRGAVVLVGGPAGIGKTCLVDRLAERAGELGLPVLRGRAVPEEGPRRCRRGGRRCSPTPTWSRCSTSTPVPGRRRGVRGCACSSGCSRRCVPRCRSPSWCWRTCTGPTSRPFGCCACPPGAPGCWWPRPTATSRASCSGRRSRSCAATPRPWR